MSKLQAWLDKEGKSRTWFGKQFKPEPVKPQTVDNWCSTPPKLPQKRYREEISRITGGEVTISDFI